MGTINTIYAVRADENLPREKFLCSLATTFLLIALWSNVTLANPLEGIRINVGGDYHTDVKGRLWRADRYFNGGQTASVSKSINATTDDALYQTQRVEKGQGLQMRYRIEVAPGDYLVTLHFAETSPLAFGDGRRVFDVLIEDQLVLNDLDVFSEVGRYTALVKTVSVHVADEQIDIRFLGHALTPAVCAIEIIPSRAIPVPIDGGNGRTDDKINELLPKARTSDRNDSLRLDHRRFEGSSAQPKTRRYRDVPDRLPSRARRNRAALLGIEKKTAIPDQYIVVFKKHMDRAAAYSRNQDLTRRGGRVHRTFSKALSGVAVTLPKQALDELREDPNVAYIEADQYVHTNVTWGLDRTDQHNRPLDHMYVPAGPADGTGVHAYIIDTGIRVAHREFTGRVGDGYSVVSGGVEDCNGHGTHVAGTVGGTTYGMAKNVTLHPVRVLDCNGSGRMSAVIAGVDWVTNNHVRPAVANLSLGGSVSSALDAAINNSIEAGVTYVVAAGNSNDNACSYSPARVDAALTTGATTSSDQRSSFSNFGSCVDIFAPGSRITSAWHTSNTATRTINGTSMAAPHTAGAAALYLSAHPGASPEQVFTVLRDTATSGILSDIGAGSPNLLLYVGEDSAIPPPPPPVRCNKSESFEGRLTARGDFDYQPVGSYYYGRAGTHEACLQGPPGANFDLYLYKWNSRGGWAVVADAASNDAIESLSYTGSSGYYLWRVTSQAGSGDYDFGLDRP